TMLGDSTVGVGVGVNVSVAVGVTVGVGVSVGVWVSVSGGVGVKGPVNGNRTPTLLIVTLPFPPRADVPCGHVTVTVTETGTDALPCSPGTASATENVNRLMPSTIALNV